MDLNNKFFQIESGRTEKNSFPVLNHRVDQTDLKPGLSISNIKLKANSDAAVSYKLDKPIIGFGCILSGDIENKRNKIRSKIHPQKSSAGVGGITFIGDSEGVICKMPGREAKILHILIEPDTLASLFEDDMNSLPDQLRQLCEGRLTGEFSMMDKMSAAVKSVAHQLANGIPHGVSKRLYLEGKTLELIALQMAFLKNGERKDPGNRALTQVERDKIISIGEQLLLYQDSPPSLQSLANQGSLSVNKLEQGFREVYGMPVFAFIRESKMQKAKLLFLETSMNVSEVAWEVGYVNVSHFGAAFKKRFGILPKQFIKKNC